MRMRLKAGLTVAITLAAVVGLYPIQAQAQVLSEQPFAGFATGTQVSVNALQIGVTQVLNVQEAFAGASVNSEGLGTPLTNEMGQAVQPALPDKNAYGKGTGLELGALTNFPDAAGVNQLILSGLAQASSPPPEGVPDPITKVLGPIDLPPLLFAGLLRGQAQAIYAPDVCAIGQPISYGNGEAANVQLVPTAAGGPGGLINTAAPGQGTTTAQSRSFEYFVPNGDGTFGLVSETRQHVAPITIGQPVLGIAPLAIEVDGEFVMRVVATGKPGLAPIGPLGSNSSIQFSDPLITVSAAGVPVIGPVTLTSLLGSGINLNLPLIADLSVGGPPRAIGSDAVPAPPVIAADGTSVSAAYDLLQLSLLEGLIGLTGADLRVGHMEAAATVPPGGIRCNIPVTKTALPDPATPGQDVTVTIQIPDPERFNIFFRCDLLNISATDTHRVVEGNPRFRIVSASNGGTISGNTVNWPNLGNYTRGDPPITLTVVLRIEGGAGLIEDIVDVSATLGNCDGGVVGQDIAGFATTGFGGGAITGRLVHRGPQVGAGAGGALPPTGGSTLPLAVGGLLLVSALGVRKLVQRSSAPKP